jgi:DNA-binding NtrC family response regulator
MTAGHPGASGAALSPPPPSASARPSLLFVDDERAILTALRVVFRGAYDVSVTTDGHEAVALLGQRHFDVVVCDQRMPTLTGVEVLRRARDVSPATIRILLTGYADTDAILGAINDVEVHRFLQKPWDNAEIKRVVDEAITLGRRVGTPPAGASGAASGGSVAGAATAPDAMPDAALLVIDPDPTLGRQLRAELGADIELLDASSVDDAFHWLGRRAVGLLVCSIDVQSDADIEFMRVLKLHYPGILVIAVCDSVDTLRLIELINFVKIFRYVRRPVNTKLLAHYVHSARRVLASTQAHPELLLMQRPEAPPEHVMAAGSVARSMTDRLAGFQAGWRQLLGRWFA